MHLNVQFSTPFEVANSSDSVTYSLTGFIPVCSADKKPTLSELKFALGRLKACFDMKFNKPFVPRDYDCSAQIYTASSRMTAKSLTVEDGVVYLNGGFEYENAIDC